MISRKSISYLAMLGLICAVGIPFAIVFFFDQPSKPKYRFRNEVVFDGITKNGEGTTDQTYIGSDGIEIQEQFYRFNSTVQAETTYQQKLIEAEKIIEQGLAPDKGYVSHNRTVAVFSDHIAIFGIVGESWFYCIKAPLLEYAIAFEERDKESGISPTFNAPN